MVEDANAVILTFGSYRLGITQAKDGKPVTIELVDAKTKEPKDTSEINVVTQRGFVLVDERMQVPHLYCIDDANEKMILAYAASAQGISGVLLKLTPESRNIFGQLSGAATSEYTRGKETPRSEVKGGVEGLVCQTHGAAEFIDVIVAKVDDIFGGRSLMGRNLLQAQKGSYGSTLRYKSVE
ncbi:hypothetical protein LOK49_LG02G03636 [Camellia lanceoleosa]|uniref:Uncharacterized protein n=1 Tax=Camellia lanceoleosa TaxID=1840588 RepID=A0ACC0IP71_9ERIC|nr:hypothetical protein LOK49_LG02G03636 [Camellia lanceoleosa]